MKQHFNIKWPVASGLLLAFMFATAGCGYGHRNPPPVKDRSIAVLPFVYAGKEHMTDYFSEGLTDEIISGLYRVRNLKVIAHNSIVRYAGSIKSTAEIAAEMHVAYLLQGELQKTEKGFSLRVRLMTGLNEKEIWSASYDRHRDDIFSVEQEITMTIAEKVDEILSADERAGISRRPTKSLEAYDQYLKGRYYYYLRSQGSLRTAIALFESATRLDTAFSRAWSGIADCYSALGYGSYEPPVSAFKKAAIAAQTALRFDSTLAEPHTSLGYVKFYYEWDWAGAEREFKEAIRLNPDYAPAYISYGYFLTARERFPEARIAFEKGLELDPVSASVNTDMGFHLYYAGNYNAAIKVLRYALMLNPKSPLAHLWLGRCLQEQLRYPEAAGEFLKTLEVDREWPVALAAAGYVYGRNRKNAEARAVLERLNRDSATTYVTPYGYALLYAGINDNEQAFAWLEKAYENRSNWMVWLKLDPRWSGIRNDKRFTTLVERVGLYKSIQKP